MSKEKNLTMLDPNGEAIAVNPHAIFKDMVSYPSAGISMVLVGYGPAIDRLHEFEKLGLEPEEIKEKDSTIERLNRENTERCLAMFDKDETIRDLQSKIEKLSKTNTELIAGKDRLKLENEGLKQEIADRELVECNLRRRIKELDTRIDPTICIRQLIEENAELTVSNMELNRSLDNLKADFENVVNGTAYQKLATEIEELQQRVTVLEETIDKFSVEETKETIDNLKKEIERLQRFNSVLKTTTNALHHYVHQRNRYIKGLESELETLRDKLERIDCIMTEDDE